MKYYVVISIVKCSNMLKLLFIDFVLYNTFYIFALNFNKFKYE